MNDFQVLIPLLAILIGGAIVLMPLAALCARFALRPILQALTEYRDATGTDRTRLRDARVDQLEEEVRHLRASVQQLHDSEEFRRQLESSTGGKLPS